MWVRSSGALSENVFQVTTAVSSHLLIIGDAAVLVDSSIAAVSERLIEGCQEVLGEAGTLDFVLLTHAEYDTLGGVLALRERYPEIELITSPKISEILSDKDTIKRFYEKNVSLAQAMNVELSSTLEQWEEALKVTRIMGDGDAIDLGEDVLVKMIACPGFTDDAVAYYVQPDSALAACEAVGGYGGRELVMNCFADDYHKYISSLQKLSALDIKILGFPHSGALSGELVNKFFMDAQSAALEFRQNVVGRIEQGEIVEEIVAALLADWQALNIAPRGPFAQEQEDTLRSMVKSIAAIKEKATAAALSEE